MMTLKSEINLTQRSYLTQIQQPNWSIIRWPDQFYDLSLGNQRKSTCPRPNLGVDAQVFVLEFDFGGYLRLGWWAFGTLPLGRRSLSHSLSRSRIGLLPHSLLAPSGSLAAIHSLCPLSHSHSATQPGWFAEMLRVCHWHKAKIIGSRRGRERARGFSSCVFW